MIVCVVFLFLVGCSPDTQNAVVVKEKIQQIETHEYSLDDFLKVLEDDKDYNDYKTDFEKLGGLDPVLVEKLKLSNAEISKRIDELNGSERQGFMWLYEGVSDNGDVWLIEVKDKETHGRYFFAVVNMKEKKVEKFLAVIGLSTGNDVLDK